MSSQTTMIVSPTYGRFLFDAVFNTTHTSTVTPTKHPVQTGANITDHAILEPDEVSIDIGMSDTATPVSSAAGNTRSVNAFAQLKAIMERREPITLVTRLGSYQNMIITSISAPDDYTTMNALKATIYFSQIRIVSVAALTIRETVSGSKIEHSQGNPGSSGDGGGDGSGGSKTGSQNNSSKSEGSADHGLRMIHNFVTSGASVSNHIRDFNIK